MSSRQLKNYREEGLCRLDIDTSDFMYLLNTDAGKLSDAVKCAIRDFKLNKIIQ